VSAGSARRPRLLFVLPNLRGGGAERVTLSLLRELDAARYELRLLVLEGPGLLTPLITAKVGVVYPPAFLRKGLVLARLVTLFHAWRSDLLVAAMEMRASFCVDFAARWLRKPAVFWVHVAFGQWAQGLGRRQRRRSRRAYSRGAPVIFVSEGARASMADWLGSAQPGWRSIPNPFSEDGYRLAAAMADTRHADLRARMASRRTVIAVGRLEPRKGFDLLLEAAALVVREGIDLDLVILGEGPQREALRQQAERLGLGDRLFMPGFVHDAREWIREASCYVLSSRLEGLPTTIIEALSVDTPVIATDCPSGPREILEQGRCGLLVPMDDPAAMAEALVRLLRSESLRLELVAAGRQRLRDFEPARVTARWDAVFREALGGAVDGGR